MGVLAHQGLPPRDPAQKPFYGTVSYLNGPTMDQPLEMTGIQPYRTWRGVIDDGVCASCSATDWPGLTYEAYLDVIPSKITAPRSWHGSLFAEGLDDGGLMYRRNRYYDPATGQFTQEDPLGLAGGMNAYGFANGDPVNFSDPFGLWPDDGDPPGGPPPVPVPNGGKDNGWKWNPDKNNKRGGTWGPRNRIPGQSQPSASQEEAKGKGIEHWDVDDGLGNRERYDDNGEPMSADEAHGKVPRANKAGGGEDSGGGVVNKLSKATGLTGAALITYIIISEGSRVFLPRNLVPVP